MTADDLGAVDDLADALVVCDARGRIVAANDALHSLLGYEPGALVGKKLEKLVPQDLRDLHRVHRDRFARDPGPGGHRGARLFPARHRDGHVVPVDIAIANLTSAEGTLSVALVRDLSDPEAAGRQVRRLADLYAFMAQALSTAARAADPEELWAAVCDVAVDRRLATLAWVAEVSDGRIEPAAASGPLATSVDGLGTVLGADHPLALAVTLGAAVVVPDLALEPAFGVVPSMARAAGSLCAVPVRRGATVVAVLSFVSPLVSGFTDEAVTVLEWLGAELGAALDRQAGLDADRARLDAQADARMAAAAERARDELDAAVAAAVAEALASERAAARAQALDEADAWVRAVDDAVADARATERAAADDELRAARQAIEQATAALAALRARAGEAAAERDRAVADAVAAAVARERADAERRLEEAGAVHERLLAEAVETTRTEERTAAAVRARYAEDAQQRALARAVEEARADERAATERERADEEQRRLREEVARRAADAELADDVGRAARLEARAAHQDVAVQLALLALATGDPTDVADAVVGAAGRTLGVDSAVLVEAGPDDRTVVRAAWFGAHPTSNDYEAGRHADLHDLVVAQGGPVVVQDLASDARFGGLVAPDDHSAGVAVGVGGAPGFHGSLSVLSVSPRAFDPDEVALLGRLAEIIAASFERARDHGPEVSSAGSSRGPAGPASDAAAPNPPAAPLVPDLNQAPLTDPVTGLPTRALLVDRTEQLLERVAHTDPLVGVLVAHLDGLDELASAHGAEVTDALVSTAADRLRSAMDPGAVLARTAADELAVVHVTEGGIEDFTDLTDRVRVALSAPYGVGSLRLSPTTSIGVSVRPATDTTADQLLREAEAATVRAAGTGRGRTELYDHDLRRQARRRLDQASALRRAIDDDELVVVWQAALPLQPTEDEQAEEVWAEALVRWRNPERGLVSPGNFIALAEETGLIVPVGEAVLRMALAQLVDWRAAEGTHPRRVAVNLSPRQLAHDGLAASVAAALDAAGLEPAAVMFEVTESAVTAGPEDAIRRLDELRDLGVGLAMDDFGTGYSSLGYLRRMPVSVLKIDQSFIRGLTTHRADWAIVHGIVEMGHGIGLTVVAEGIETAEQLDHLVALGCDRGQGYFWSSPVPADALDQLLAGWTPPGRRP